MNIDFYKLYIKKENGGYDNAIIIKDKKELLNRISALKQEYMIIGYNSITNEDVLIDYQECKVEFVDNIKTKMEVKTKVFKPKELEKPSKKNRAKRKQNLYNDLKDYIDR